MFKVKKNLYSLSSVCHAHEDIVKDLMNAEVTGSKQEEFVNDNKNKEIIILLSNTEKQVKNYFYQHS